MSVPLGKVAEKKYGWGRGTYRKAMVTHVLRVKNSLEVRPPRSACLAITTDLKQRLMGQMRKHHPYRPDMGMKFANTPFESLAPLLKSMDRVLGEWKPAKPKIKPEGIKLDKY